MLDHDNSDEPSAPASPGAGYLGLAAFGRRAIPTSASAVLRAPVALQIADPVPEVAGTSRSASVKVNCSLGRLYQYALRDMARALCQVEVGPVFARPSGNGLVGREPDGSWSNWKKDHLDARLARAVRRQYQYTDKNGRTQSADFKPPQPLMADVKRLWTDSTSYFPKLDIVARGPVFARDSGGSMWAVAAPGFYDGLVRIYLDVPESIPVLDGDTFVDAVDVLLRDYAFATLRDALAAIAAMITVLIRPSLPEVVPAIFISAPDARSAKSTLAKTVTALGAGSVLSSVTLPENPVELPYSLATHA